ncbi:2TM domain-containing protein [Aequorivita sp. H23M31]|uniref:2TM domain-containing protein n=1 Tax=Aequorivita ciconiae TaxID=2494375 RepID=A0A410G703_9FLAO|nr:2TM domain-containing protein [Aequorivita sp. H23M31]QAA82955.1 2TM domain-containing protein [Aequorivita sp. H23M31]
METKKSLKYLRAHKKVEILKHFYSHLAVFIIINTGIILVLANAFGKGPTYFSKWEVYFTLFFWGIGILFHALYVLFEITFRGGFLKRWEDRKMKQFLEEDRWSEFEN